MANKKSKKNQDATPMKTEDLIQLFLKNKDTSLLPVLAKELPNFKVMAGQYELNVVRHLSEEVILDVALQAKENILSKDKNIREASQKLLRWAKNTLRDEYFKNIIADMKVIHKDMPAEKRLQLFDEEWIANHLREIINPTNKESFENKFKKIRLLVDMLPPENIWEDKPDNRKHTKIYQDVMTFAFQSNCNEKDLDNHYREYFIQQLAQKRGAAKKELSKIIQNVKFDENGENDLVFKTLKLCMCTPDLAEEVITKIARDGRPQDLECINKSKMNERGELEDVKDMNYSNKIIYQGLMKSQNKLPRYSCDKMDIYDVDKLSEFKRLSLEDAINKGYKAIVQLKLEKLSDKEIRNLLYSLDPLDSWKAGTSKEYFSCLNLVLDKVHDKSIIAGYLSSYTHTNKYSRTVAGCLLQHINSSNDLQNQSILAALAKSPAYKNLSSFENRKILLHLINSPSMGHSEEHILRPLREQLFHDCILDAMNQVIRDCSKKSSSPELLLVGKKEDKIRKLTEIKSEFEQCRDNPNKAERIIEAFSHVASQRRGWSVPVYAEEFKQIVSKIHAYAPLKASSQIPNKDKIIKEMKTAIHKMMSKDRNPLKEKFLVSRSGTILAKSKKLYEMLDQFEKCNDNEIQFFYNQFSTEISRGRFKASPEYADAFKENTKLSMQEISNQIKQTLEVTLPSETINLKK